MAVAALWACDGDNLFAPTGALSGGQPPGVEIEYPTEPAARPIGDSVLVTARTYDDVGVDSLLFYGVSFRGDDVAVIAVIGVFAVIIGAFLASRREV